MDRSVVFVGTFRIPDYAAWRGAIAEMADFVSANVPGVTAFHAYVDETRTEGTVVYRHPDGDSLDQHLVAAAELIRRGSDMVDVVRVELLGAPNTGTVERLRSSGVSVEVKELVTGFSRSGTRDVTP